MPSLAALKPRPPQLYHQIRFLGALVAQIRTPSAENTLKMETRVVKMASPENIRTYVNAMRETPHMAEMLKNRYVPPIYRLEDLGGFPPGSLAEAYCRHMTAGNLSPDFFPRFDLQASWDECDADYHYIRVRMYQTHDFWHTITGYGTDYLGEIATVGFYLGHSERHLGANAHYSMAFTGILAATSMLHSAMLEPTQLKSFLKVFHEGWARGQAARPLWAVKWEELWAQPLEKLRLELNIQAAAA